MLLPPTTIRNATNGAISDPVAQQWGHAFQLTEAYYFWAMQHNARDALTSGALADPNPGTVANLFSGDLMQLDQAKQAGGLLVYTPPRIPATQSVTIPAELQEAMRRQGLVPKGFGLAVQFTGPSRRAIRMSDGSETVLTQRDASYTITVVIWGELRNDLDLGSVWYEYGNYGCDGAVRNVCQL